MNIITPQPREIITNENVFTFSKETSINTTISDLAEYLKTTLALDTGIILEQTSTDSKIELFLDESLELECEGYILRVSEISIIISASSEEGLFYGIQTLRQLLYEKKGKWFVDGVKIIDKPRFEWRGFMLDVCRHYQPVETIKKLIDAICLVKMNKLHLHLTEDQGWRIEIKNYPKLTEIGSKRKDTKIGSHLSKKFRGEPHSGFYTQEEIRDVIQYAKKRYVEVIPEINIPGHSSAAISSYPNLSCKGEQIEVKTKPGIYADIYCAGKETTFDFLEGVLDEVIEIFPSKYIHIGGDEAPKTRWKACPYCQERIKKENLKDERDLQVYFTNRVAKYLESKGKCIIGWNEILGESLNKNAIVQWWLGNPKKVKKYIPKGRKFVMSPFGKTYLDYNYLMHPMRKFYFEPVPNPVKTYESGIIGVETPIWTEWVPNLERLGWQVFPRLFATAEVAWTKPNLMNYALFKKRIPQLLKFLDALGIPYAELEEVDPSNWKRFTHLRKWLQWPEV
ncbi:MAG: beta-N-acetylhexosaminidase [Candidatus Lokiarchaeota archaeon]|nr:beta-N-acetylhexosaminidase [Candidatus Lokiarchaeota archaeon]